MTGIRLVTPYVIGHELYVGKPRMRRITSVKSIGVGEVKKVILHFELRLRSTFELRKLINYPGGPQTPPVSHISHNSSRFCPPLSHIRIASGATG